MVDLPARIGTYEIQARLGVGGMAEAYVALRRGPGGFAQRVCIKRIRPDAADDPELVRQFLAEAAVVARLRHGAITQVLDFGRDGNDYYLALELIDGVDLRELIACHPAGLAPELVQYIAAELATALDFAHRAGGEPGAGAIVHRDVSSSNVLLSREGEVKLSDFGIARPLDAPQHTRTGIVKGKVPYLAPEYARSGRFDARCDLFSLGVVLYECLSGERPHDGATELETLERATRGARTALSELAPRAPAALVTETEALLEADPELRTQSAAQLLEALLALPSSPRARRELGALVSACKAGRELAREVPVGPTEPWPAAERSDDPARAATIGLGRAGARVRIGRGPLLALAAALVLAALVLAFAARRGTSLASAARPETTTNAVATAPPGTNPDQLAGTAVPADALSPLAAEPTKLQAQAAAEPAAPTRDTVLEVIVMPYGTVSIDGHEIGKAPVNVKLAPGEHAIRARNRDGTIDRQLTLRPGERRQLVLR